MIDPELFLRSARVVKEAYEVDEEFRRATIASVLSAIKELKGSHSDEDVAVAVADRLFTGS